MRILDLLPSRAIASEHADVLLELAYLMTAVDGRLAPQELAAFREIAGKLHDAPPEIDALVARYGGSTTKEAISERVRSIAPSLPGDLREVAFKLAIALALVDDDAAPSITINDVTVAEGNGGTTTAGINGGGIITAYIHRYDIQTSGGTHLGYLYKQAYYNASMVGPVTVGSGVTLTVDSGATLVFL